MKTSKYLKTSSSSTTKGSYFSDKELFLQSVVKRDWKRDNELLRCFYFSIFHPSIGGFFKINAVKINVEKRVVACIPLVERGVMLRRGDRTEMDNALEWMKNHLKTGAFPNNRKC